MESPYIKVYNFWPPAAWDLASFTKVPKFLQLNFWNILKCSIYTFKWRHSGNFIGQDRGGVFKKISRMAKFCSKRSQVIENMSVENKASKNIPYVLEKKVIHCFTIFAGRFTPHPWRAVSGRRAAIWIPLPQGKRIPRSTGAVAVEEMSRVASNTGPGGAECRRVVCLVSAEWVSEDAAATESLHYFS